MVLFSLAWHSNCQKWWKLTETLSAGSVTVWHSSWQTWFVQVRCRPHWRPHDFDTASLQATRLVCQPVRITLYRNYINVITAQYSHHYTNINWCWGQRWKIMPRSFAMWIDANSQYLFSYITNNEISFYLFYHRISSMMQQHRICIDLPTIAVKPKNWCKCTVRHSLHHVPREHDATLTKSGNIVYFCTSCDARWTNHVRIIQIII